MVSIKYISTIALTAAAAFAADESPAPAGTKNGDNPIVHPGWGEKNNAGGNMNIEWKPTTSGKVNLVLRSGDQNDLDTVTKIASGIDNSGSYKWSIPDDITRNTAYTVEIQDADDTKNANYSPYFAILLDGESGVSSALTSGTKSAASATDSAASASSSGAASTKSGSKSKSAATKMSQTSGSSSTSGSASATGTSSDASSTSTASASSSATSSGASSSAASSSASASSTASEDGAAKPTGGLMALVAAGAIALL